MPTSAGARAGLLVLDAPSHPYLAYRPRVPLTGAVWRAGRREGPARVLVEDDAPHRVVVCGGPAGHWPASISSSRSSSFLRLQTGDEVAVFAFGLLGGEPCPPVLGQMDQAGCSLMNRSRRSSWSNGSAMTVFLA